MLVAHGNGADLPGYDALTVTLMPVGSTSQRSVQEPGFASSCLLTPLRRLYPLPVRRASALPTASFGFHLTMDTLAVRLTLPLAGCVEDFHLQVNAPCRAHNLKTRHFWRVEVLSTAANAWVPTRLFLTPASVAAALRPIPVCAVQLRGERHLGLQGRAPFDSRDGHSKGHCS